MVVKPNFGCSTELIYSNVKYFSKIKYKNPDLSLFDNDNLVNSKNDLENVAFSKYPKLKKIKLALLNFPGISFVRMSGSGSSIVAYFHSKRSMNIAAKKFKEKFNNYWCITSKTL